MSLKELRLKRGMTQQQLADKVPGINRARVASWETGHRDIADVSFRTAIRLGDALRVSNLRKLLDDDSSSEDSTESNDIASD